MWAVAPVKPTFANFKMATHMEMEDVTDPDEPGASGGNTAMRSPGQDSMALADSPPSKRAKREEAVEKLARLEREMDEARRVIFDIDEGPQTEDDIDPHSVLFTTKVRLAVESAYKGVGLPPTRAAQPMATVDGAEKYAGKDLEDVPISKRRDAAVKEGVLMVKKWFDLPQRKADLAAANLLTATIPVDEGSLPWGPRVVGTGMIAQRVVAGGNWDINSKEGDLSKGCVDSSDFLKKKFFGSADRRYGKIMPPKEELFVPEVEPYDLERPYAMQIPVLEHAAGEFVDPSKLSKIGGRSNRSTVDAVWPPPMMDKIERCVADTTSALSTGEWFGIVMDLILAKLQQGIGDPATAYEDLRVLRNAQLAVETDVLFWNIAIRTTCAHHRRLAVIDASKMHGLSADMKRCMSLVDLRGDELFDGRLKEFINEAGDNANRRAAQNLEKCVATLVDHKQVTAKAVTATTTSGSYSTPYRREDYNRSSSTNRVDNYTNRRDTSQYSGHPRDTAPRGRGRGRGYNNNNNKKPFVKNSYGYNNKSSGYNNKSSGKRGGSYGYRS